MSLRSAVFAWASLATGCVVLLTACRSKDVKTPVTEVIIPPAIGDAGALSIIDAASRSPARLGSSTGDGWMVQPDRGSNPVYVARAVVLAAMKTATQRAVLHHDSTIEECSSAGGSHAFFEMIKGGAGMAHYGGHGTHLMHAFEQGTFWVASIEPMVPKYVKNEAWCVPGHILAAKVIALVPVANREEAMQLFEDLNDPAR